MGRGRLGPGPPAHRARDRALRRDRRQPGWREFVVAEKIRESEVITSFVLRPAGGGTVVAHRPGQYLTFSFDLPGRGVRNDSISSAPNGSTYRISVKREAGGIVPGWLHDAVDPGDRLRLAPPAGDFVLPEAPDRPVVLLSGRVGLTPMIAMLETLAATRPETPVQFVHGTLDGFTHAMGERVRPLTGSGTRRAALFYEARPPTDVPGWDFDLEGRVTPAWLHEHTPFAKAGYFVCGPRGFLSSCVRGLARAGVDRDRIHYENFGPAEQVLAA